MIGLLNFQVPRMMIIGIEVAIEKSKKENLGQESDIAKNRHNLLTTVLGKINTEDIQVLDLNPATDFLQMITRDTNTLKLTVRIPEILTILIDRTLEKIFKIETIHFQIHTALISIEIKTEVMIEIPIPIEISIRKRASLMLISKTPR